MSYEYKIVGYDQNGVVKTELMPVAPTEPQVNSDTYLKAQANLAAAICNYEKDQERIKTALNTNLFEGYTSPFDPPDEGVTRAQQQNGAYVAQNGGLLGQALQPKPTDYNCAADQNAKQQAALAGMSLSQYQQLQRQYQAALRQVVTNQPDYDIRTETMTRQLHEEILANQTKNYELKLDAMRREIAELKLSQPRKGCWPPDDAFDDSWHWLVTAVNGTLMVDKAKWVKCWTGGFWIMYGANHLGVKIMADECNCIYAGSAEDEKTQPNPADGVYILRTKHPQNPVTATPTTTKTTPFPLNALTNQTQRIGLTTERCL